jgi:hypothetical protein
MYLRHRLGVKTVVMFTCSPYRLLFMFTCSPYRLTTKIVGAFGVYNKRWILEKIVDRTTELYLESFEGVSVGGERLDRRRRALGPRRPVGGGGGATLRAHSAGAAHGPVYLLLLHRALLLAQVYLAIYFATLALAVAATGLEPLRFFRAASPAAYAWSQAAQSLGLGVRLRRRPHGGDGKRLWRL